MVEVPMISRDSRRLKEAEDLLQTYKWVICKVCSLVDEIVLFVSSIWYTILNPIPVGNCWSEENDKWRKDSILGQHTQCFADACKTLLKQFTTIS
jgi:hypothetical protein